MWYRLKYKLTAIFLICLSTGALSQSLDKYIIIHKNRKNDSQIKPSPLASGYEKNEAHEFTYEPVPTEAMKKRIKAVIDPNRGIELQEKESDIFGADYENELFLEESGTLLQELDEEAAKAIANQKAAAMAATVAKRNINLASYTASVEAKKKRAREAATIAATENKNQTSTLSQTAYYEEEYEEPDLEEEEASDSFTITGSQGGKIQIKSNSAPSSLASQTTAP